MSNTSTGYNFNNFQEIKSHSSVLYNERMAILFYLLDMKNLVLHKTQSLDAIYDVHAVLRQIFKNVRMLLRFNEPIRMSLNLETKEPGVYTIDVAMARVKRMLKYCEINGYTERRVYIIIEELDNSEMMLKDIMQYFHYFIRPDFQQKPDVDMATERYKEMADAKTIDELRELVGKQHQLDFEALGSKKITRTEEFDEISYDESVDGPLEEYQSEDDDIELEA